MVVVVDVAVYARLQFLDVGESVEIEELGLERSEEALHRGIIQAVSFARHALGETLVAELFAIGWYLIVPPLIGVQKWRIGPSL